MKTLISLLTLCGMMLIPSCGTALELLEGDSVLLKDGWKIRKEGDRKEYSATVPSTVAAVLLENGVIPEDILYDGKYYEYDSSVLDGDWWYSNRFKLSSPKGRNYTLTFDGLNYYADIWLNGVQIASSDTTYGVFVVRKYDVTELVRPNNELKIKLSRAKDGDLNIGYVDWNPRPFDESMGIVRNVTLSSFSKVEVSDVFVSPDLNLETLAEADLEVRACLRNVTDDAVSGVLSGAYDEKTFSVPVSLEAGETREVILTSDIVPELHVDSPRIWWCNGLGTPELYDMDLSFSVDGRMTDSESVSFGIRSITGRLDDNGYREFILNGRKVLVLGAGWTDEIFLRDTHESLENQVRYVADMNLNCIRFENIWGKDSHIYDLCDRYGIMALVGWSCFWEWEGYCGIPAGDYGCIDSPELNALAASYYESQVKWLRNHPSVIGWMTASDKLPSPEVEKEYLSISARHDDKPYICSAKNLKSELSGPSGVKMYGPYEYVGPEYWYQDKKNGGAYGFNTETSIGVNLPQKESIMKMMPSDSLWPLSLSWDRHCTTSKTAMNNMNVVADAVTGTFGEADGFEDFVKKAHALDYDGTRAMFDAFRVNQPGTTGLIQWMLNSAWPSMYWQLYDYYLIPTAGYYAVKKACSPIQLIYNYDDSKVYLVSDRMNSEDCSVEITAYDRKSSVLASYRSDVTACKPVQEIYDLTGFRASDLFVFMKLTSADGVITNSYAVPAEGNIHDWARTNWVHTPMKRYADMSYVTEMPETHVTCTVSECNSESSYVTVKNTSDKIAYQVILKLKDKDGCLMSPVFWSDNFFALQPGEEYTVTCRTTDNIQGIVECEWWN